MNEVRNPFASEVDAKRYQSYRPRYHHLPFQQLLEWNVAPFDHALDIACGTGHSTLALKKIAKNIKGCDLSKAMLGQARQMLPDVPFYCCHAETTPFETNSLNLINISKPLS